MGALLNVLKTAGPRLLNALKGNVPAMERLALRLKLPVKGITAEKIMNVVKSNGLAAILVANEMFGKHDADSIAIAQAVDNGLDVINSLNFKIDEVSEDDKKSSDKFDDEFEVISDAIGIMGSLERLMIVAKAVQMPQPLFAQYRKERARGRRMR